MVTEVVQSNTGAVVVLALATAAVVYVDALLFGRRRGFESGAPGLVPATWAVFVAFLLPIGLPWYFVRRQKVSRQLPLPSPTQASRA
jgi:hypothetical protein